jgi:1,4-alpha-glucan branching enzyme
MPQGYLCLVLHAHLPFVRHPEHNDFLEEDWFYEGITETYIPLLEMFDALERDGVDWRLTMSVTPTLAAMLADPLLQARYVRHIDNLIALAEKELVRTRMDPAFHDLAKFYHDRFTRCRDLFVNKYDRNLLHGFRHFYDSGKLELITCAATHGLLPLMMPNWNAIRAQIEIGCREFARHFGRRPRGIWLPECAYYPGIDHALDASGIKYFFVDTHGVLYAEPRPRFGVYAPIICPGSGVAALARDTESSKQVWSSIEGYPGDYNYRDFYRDVGFDLDFDYLKPHLHEVGVRTHLGIKYYKITGKTVHKQPYQPHVAHEKAAEHAGNFMFNRQRQVEWLSDQMDGRPPLVVAPYDAELFGHWWYEGPEFLNYLFRKIHFDQDIIKTTTVSEHLDRQPINQISQPHMSSWGAKGYYEVWLDPVNDWIYPHLHEIAERMVRLAQQFPQAEGVQRRALNQAARELLLAQASDWAFILKMGTVVEYATQRTKVHVDHFLKLSEQIVENRIDVGWLEWLESRFNLFPDLDYRLYA